MHSVLIMGGLRCQKDCPAVRAVGVLVGKLFSFHRSDRAQFVALPPKAFTSERRPHVKMLSLASTSQKRLQLAQSVLLHMCLLLISGSPSLSKRLSWGKLQGKSRRPRQAFLQHLEIQINLLDRNPSAWNFILSHSRFFLGRWRNNFLSWSLVLNGNTKLQYHLACILVHLKFAF